MAASAVNHKQLLVDAFESFQDAQGELTHVKTWNSAEAEKAARGLAEAAQAFRRHLLERGEAAQLLRDEEIPFPQAYCLVKALAEPEIQCYERLKEEISKAMRIFVELVVFQCSLREKRIYGSTAEAMSGWINKVIKTLPEDEVICRFELNCTKASIKMLNTGIGKWKEIAQKGGKELGVGILEVVCSITPSGASFSPLAKPLVNVAIAIYQAMEERWYQNIWALRWSIAEAVTKKKEFEEKIKPLIENYAIDNSLTIYMAQLFREIICNKKAERELKTYLIKGEPRTNPRKKEPSLLTLLKLTGSAQPLRGKHFWETRFCTLVQIESLPLRIQEKLIPEVKLKYISSKEKRRVREKAGKVLANFFQQGGKMGSKEYKKVMAKTKQKKEFARKRINNFEVFQAVEEQLEVWEQTQANLRKKENKLLRQSQLGERQFEQSMKVAPINEVSSYKEEQQCIQKKLQNADEKTFLCKKIKKNLKSLKVQYEATQRLEEAQLQYEAACRLEEALIALENDQNVEEKLDQLRYPLTGNYKKSASQGPNLVGQEALIPTLKDKSDFSWRSVRPKDPRIMQDELSAQTVIMTCCLTEHALFLSNGKLCMADGRDMKSFEPSDQGQQAVEELVGRYTSQDGRFDRERWLKEVLLAEDAEAAGAAAAEAPAAAEKPVLRG